jgi:GNAT superfamily N-acetyltransferase
MPHEDPCLVRRTLTLSDGPTLLIRPIAPIDSLDELTDLLHRAYRPLADMGFRFVATHQTPDVTAKRIAGAHCWVVTQGPRLAGTITLSEPDRKRDSPCDYYRRPGVWTCNQLAVDPPLQRRGVGGALMDLVETAAAQSGASEIALDTAEGAAHLIRSYQSRGYRQVGHVRWSSTNYRSVILSKTFVQE